MSTNTELATEIRAGSYEDRAWMMSALDRAADALEAAEAELRFAKSELDISERTSQMSADAHMAEMARRKRAEAELTRRDTVIAAVKKWRSSWASEAELSIPELIDLDDILAAAPVSLEAVKAETATEWAQADADRSGVPVAVVQQLHDAGWAYVLSLAGIPAWIQPSSAAVSTLRRRPVSEAGDDRG